MLVQRRHQQHHQQQRPQWQGQQSAAYEVSGIANKLACSTHQHLSSLSLSAYSRVAHHRPLFPLPLPPKPQAQKNLKSSLLTQHGDELCGPDRSRRWCIGVLAAQGPPPRCIHCRAAGHGRAFTHESPGSKCMQPSKPSFFRTLSTCQQHGSLGRCSWLHWASRKLASPKQTHILQTTMAPLHTWAQPRPQLPTL